MGILRSITQSRSRIALAGIILATILFCIFFLYASKTDEVQLDRSSQDQGPDQADAYGEKVTFTQLRPNGEVHYKLRAQSIKQYQNQQVTNMVEPRLHLTSPNAAPWDITAKDGIIQKQKSPQGQPEDAVFLNNNVVMIQANPNNGLITLRSEAFEIYPQREFAQTDQNVMIDTQVGRTIAGGLRTNMATGLLILNSGSSQRVHTIILPEQFRRERGKDSNRKP